MRAKCARTGRGRRAVAAALSFAAVLLVAACTSPEEREAQDVARLEAMEAAIDAMIADRTCGGDGDCRAIAFGAKPCGGPWSYKVYSAARVDSTELAVAVAEYNAYNEELNRRYGWVSTCDFVSEPAVGCVGSECAAIAP